MRSTPRVAQDLEQEWLHASAGYIHEARTRAGLSQSELARRAGMQPSTISMYEGGRRQPSLPVLLRILDAAGFTLEPSGRRQG